MFARRANLAVRWTSPRPFTESGRLGSSSWATASPWRSRATYMIGLVSAEGQIGIRLTPTWRCSYAAPVVSVAVEKNRCSYSMPLNNLQSSLPSGSSAVIEFRKVNKWFGSLHVLKDIDLSVEASKVFVVCGPRSEEHTSE